MTMAPAVHLPCDRKQTRRMRHRAARQITNVLEVCLNSTRTKEQWSRLRREKHEELYAKSTKRGVTNNGPSVDYLAVNEASCGFEEAVALLHFDSTARFRLLMKLLHGRDFKDGALMAIGTDDQLALDGLAADTQHAAIRFTYRDHRKSVLLRDQHLTFFQTLKVLLPDTLPEHERDYRNAAASLSATALPLTGPSARPNGGVHKRTVALSWLPFPRSHGASQPEPARQVDLRYTLIVEEIAVHRLRLSCVTSSYHEQHKRASTSSPWTARAIARRLALRSVGKLEAAVAAARLGGCQFVAPHQWVRNEDRARCVVCWKRFHALFRRRHHCRLCGEVICGSCCSLRTTNVVNVETRAAQKTRICHMCHNEARLPTGALAFSSGNPRHIHTSTRRVCVDRPRQEQPPLLESDSDVELPRSARADSADRSDVTLSAFEVLSPSVDLLVSERTMSETLEASSGMWDLARVESDGYIGALPDRTTDTAVTSSKIISIKSIARRTKTLWQAMPSTTTSSKALWPFRAPDSSSSVNSTCSVHSSEWAGGRRSIGGGFEASILEDSSSRSFLHPSVAVSRSKRTTTQPMVGITAEASSYSSVERSFRASCELVHSKELDEEDSRWFTYRRTSLMSSNAGLLDQESSAYEGCFLPTLDIAREAERLKLLDLIVSPACTLVDRTVMHRSCEIAAAAFGLSAAFIARVDETFVMIEHSIGTCSLSPLEVILRRESLCDFVLCQPQCQPLVVVDCLVDPRTRDLPMVQHLCMRFFIGISVCVRGLPIACLCAFEQGDGKQYEGDGELVSASYCELDILRNAARRMEDELESLVHGLELC